MMTAFALVPVSDEKLIPLQTVREQLNIYATALLNVENAAFLHEEPVQPADTVSSLLVRLGISDYEALEFIRTSCEAQLIFHQSRPCKVVTAKTDNRGALIALYFFR